LCGADEGQQFYDKKPNEIMLNLPISALLIHNLQHQHLKQSSDNNPGAGAV
jgi:hypothetical protein